LISELLHVKLQPRWAEVKRRQHVVLMIRIEHVLESGQARNDSTCLRFRSATLIVNSLSRLMHQHPPRPTLLLFAGAMLASLAVPLAQRQAAIPRRVPTFHVDPLWPKQLPNKWIV